MEKLHFVMQPFKCSLKVLPNSISELSAEKATLSASVKVLTQDLEIQKEKNAGLKKRVSVQ